MVQINNDFIVFLGHFELHTSDKFMSALSESVYSYCVIKAESEVPMCIKQAGLSHFQKHLS